MSCCDPLSPATLCGPRIRLQPARLNDADSIYSQADAATFRLMATRPDPWSVDGCRRYLARFLEDPRIVQFSVFDSDTDKLIGGTSFRDIRAEHRGLEIGSTWIAPGRRGTGVNAEMKLLLLRHLFETPVFEFGPALRVMLKTHHDNIRSQRAIEKIGAIREGVMRNHMVMPDGTLRHTVVYSITPDEWGGVRRRLERQAGGASQ